MSANPIVRAVHIVLLVGAAALLAFLAEPLSASASTVRASLTVPRVDTVQLGPISGRDGFNLYLTAQDCGSSDPYLQIAYLKGSSGDVLSHTYTGPSATCSIQRDPAGAELRVRLPGFVNIAVRIGHTKAALRHPGLPVGCGAPYGPELPAGATGHIDLAIHPSVFGRISARTASAQIFSGAPQRCPGLQPSGGRELTADVGRFILDADQPTHGVAQLDILDPSDDSPAPDLEGELEIRLSGHAALRVDAHNGSTEIAGATRLTSGALTFAALAVCPGYQAQNGTLGGTLTLEDPLLGSLRIIGADAGAAFTGEGSARPGTCNGPGSESVDPALLTTCNERNAGCSVKADSSVATFFDETSPGTQTITSETVNFGDGSTPLAITNYGSLRHSYGAAGSYTATLSITDQLGSAFSFSIPVVIDP